LDEPEKKRGSGRRLSIFEENMSELKKFTKAEVAEHKSFKDGKKDVWCIFEGKVYDISSFIEDHPGGEEVLLDRAGDDMTQQFADIGHSDYARQLMKGMLLGELVRTDFPTRIQSQFLSRNISNIFS
jgi:cytochrome b involved in lipid metabolism